MVGVKYKLEPIGDKSLNTCADGLYDLGAPHVDEEHYDPINNVSHTMKVGLLARVDSDPLKPEIDFALAANVVGAWIRPDGVRVIINRWPIPEK